MKKILLLTAIFSVATFFAWAQPSSESPVHQLVFEIPQENHLDIERYGSGYASCVYEVYQSIPPTQYRPFYCYQKEGIQISWRYTSAQKVCVTVTLRGPAHCTLVDTGIIAQLPLSLEQVEFLRSFGGIAPTAQMYAFVLR